MNLLDETLTSKAKEGPKDINNFSGVNTLSNSFFQLRNLSEIRLPVIPNQSINPALGIFLLFLQFSQKMAYYCNNYFVILDFIFDFIVSMFVFNNYFWSNRSQFGIWIYLLGLSFSFWLIKTNGELKQVFSLSNVFLFILFFCLFLQLMVGLRLVAWSVLPIRMLKVV